MGVNSGVGLCAGGRVQVADNGGPAYRASLYYPCFVSSMWLFKCFDSCF